ncbi:YoaK family protein [Liquorilactobacillus cacaonum]|uniref:DUF1275 domain-containing protein n=1 Tax=Liquorilactobacillus cacaonum DSM 21116 TaxID=1423729 RepID=A0A0R2CG48_9LACO|nr:YoaK family protein [Liquorilactobacillus cacaonum]KRM90669.1 hypothetical protein FC80_GL000659 [Liquorilactobacillus cacaonum DSM 21116]
MKNHRIHESIYFAAILTMIAGGIDAYSYIFHGEVFAGLQTGNLTLLGIQLGHLQFKQAIRYISSIIAFSVGTVVVREIQHKYKEEQANLRRYIILFFEFILLVAVSLISNVVPNYVSSILLSIAAAAELQEFRVLKGKAFTPLMMTGNLRTLMENLYDSLKFRNIENLKKARDTFIIMVSFAFGAALIGVFSIFLGMRTILIPALLVIISMISLRYLQKK